jgi:hypothetical protein
MPAVASDQDHSNGSAAETDRSRPLLVVGYWLVIIDAIYSAVSSDAANVSDLAVGLS